MVRFTNEISQEKSTRMLRITIFVALFQKKSALE